jgi:mono/diheme cytochrome c family protein
MSVVHRSLSTFAAASLLVLAACGGEKSAPQQDASAAASNVASATSTAPGQGEKIYAQRCQSCHQLNGEGAPGVYPPLAGSEFVLDKNAAVPASIVIHGLQGAITVKGQSFNSLMPAYGIGITMSDEEVAAVVTYIRTSWGNTASAVTAAEVAAAREATKSHSGAMTTEALAPLRSK